MNFSVKRIHVKSAFDVSLHTSIILSNCILYLSAHQHVRMHSATPHISQTYLYTLNSLHMRMSCSHAQEISTSTKILLLYSKCALIIKFYLFLDPKRASFTLVSALKCLISILYFFK